MSKSTIQFALFGLLFVAVAAPVEQAAAAEEAYSDARQQLLELMEDEKRKRYRDQWERVIHRLDRAAAKLPQGEIRCAAWYNGARAYAEMAKVSFLERDREEATRRYRQMADRCASSFLADDALFRVAEIYLERDPAKAQANLRELIERFPKGDMVPLARRHLSELSTQVAAAPQQAKPGAAEPAREPPKVEEEIPGSKLPSAVELLAALDSEGPDHGEQPPAREAASAKEREILAAMGEAVEGEVPLSIVAGLKVKRVVLDPGHGGTDPGAIGPDGTKEKDLTLAMAKKLRSQLEALGLEVFMTRDRDVTLSLEDRTRFANEKSADLFLSIHVNASHNKKAFGIETYTLNLNSDRYAMRLAARENATSTRKIGDLQFILADLATKANTADSVQLAQSVQGKLVQNLAGKHGDAIRDLGVKQALFYVLVGAKMPAVLLELGFISHPEEGKRLQKSSYQEEVVKGVAAGVRQFILDRETIARGALETEDSTVF